MAIGDCPQLALACHVFWAAGIRQPASARNGASITAAQWAWFSAVRQGAADEPL